MTAKDSVETKRASYQAGAKVYLPKPFAFDLLVTTIQEITNTGPGPKPFSHGAEPDHGATP